MTRLDQAAAEAEPAPPEPAAAPTGHGAGPKASPGAPKVLSGTAPHAHPPQRAGGVTEMFRQAAAILRKDLLAELRSGEVLLSMLLFAVLVVLVFAFAFVRGGAPLPDVAAGILWVALAFAGTLGLSRAWDREREADGLRALLLSPASRAGIYLGKVAGIFVFLAVTSLFIIPLVGVLFQVDILAMHGRVVGLVALGLAGFSIVGGFFGALMAKSRARDLLLFIVLYPLLMPLFISGVMGTSQVFADHPNLAQLHFFTSLLAVFDLVMLVVSLWTFERLITLD